MPTLFSLLSPVTIADGDWLQGAGSSQANLLAGIDGVGADAVAHGFAELLQHASPDTAGQAALPVGVENEMPGGGNNLPDTPARRLPDLAGDQNLPCRAIEPSTGSLGLSADDTIGPRELPGADQQLPVPDLDVKLVPEPLQSQQIQSADTSNPAPPAAAVSSGPDKPVADADPALFHRLSRQAIDERIARAAVPDNRSSHQPATPAVSGADTVLQAQQPASKGNEPVPAREVLSAPGQPNQAPRSLIPGGAAGPALAENDGQSLTRVLASDPSPEVTEERGRRTPVIRSRGVLNIPQSPVFLAEASERVAGTPAGHPSLASHPSTRAEVMPLGSDSDSLPTIADESPPRVAMERGSGRTGPPASIPLQPLNPQMAELTKDLRPVVAGSTPSPADGGNAAVSSGLLREMLAQPQHDYARSGKMLKTEGPLQIIRQPVSGEAFPAMVPSPAGEEIRQVPVRQHSAGLSAEPLAGHAQMQSPLQGNALLPSANASGLATTAPQAQSSIEVPLGQSAWEQSMAKQVVQAGQQQLQTLSLRLNPVNLGSLEVQIAVEGESTSIVFSSQHAVVREAVESAIPRLREMFATSGMNLADVDVSQRGAAERHGEEPPGGYQQEQDSGSGEAFSAHPKQSDEASSAVMPDGSDKLLDYYI